MPGIPDLAQDWLTARSQFIAWMQEIEQRLVDLERQQIEKVYTVANLSESRSIDGSTATASEVRDVVATVVQDLKDQGVLP